MHPTYLHPSFVLDAGHFVWGVDHGLKRMIPENGEGMALERESRTARCLINAERTRLRS